MTILIAPDKFKGSLSAKQVCAAIARGLQQVRPDVVPIAVPMADGGEGTCELLTEWSRGTFIEKQVRGPRFTPVRAHYGISGDGKTAFIEMAAASGLGLLKDSERNPLLTSTVGTGELIADALSRNVSRIVLGLGGSATVDAGIGMASALGFAFHDTNGAPLNPVGENLIHIRSIQPTSVPPELKNVRFTALCDVTNPLFGPKGAAYVYGPQKGGQPPALDLLDAGLRNFRKMARKYSDTSADFPGAGAAGGLAAGAKVFLDASIERGIDFIIKTTELEEKINNADLVITGEGKVDDQTFSGKVVSAVAALSAKAGKPVVVICGKSDLPFPEVQRHGVKRLITLVDESTPVQDAMKKADSLIAERAATLASDLNSLQ